MVTINLTSSEVRALASIGSVASKADVTPVITGVNLIASLIDGITGTATDRYQVARVTIPFRDEITDAEANVIIPADLLNKYFAAVKSQKLERFGTVIHIDEDERTVSLSNTSGELTNSGMLIIGNFPPVGRLIDPIMQRAIDIDAGKLEAPTGVSKVTLNVKLLSSLMKIMHPGDAWKISKTGSLTWRFYFGAEEEVKDLSRVPVYASRVADGGNDNGARVDYILQPNISLR